MRPLSKVETGRGCLYNRFIRILDNGTIDKIENYLSKPLNVVHWGEYEIVIRTNQGLNIHQCK